MIALLLPAVLAQATGGDVPSINAQLFDPTIDSATFLWADDSVVADSGDLRGRVLASWAHNPLVYLNDDNEPTELVEELLMAHLLGAAALGPVRFGLDLPITLRSIGSEPGATGTGDVAGDIKVRVVDRAIAPVGVAVGARLGLPTATVATTSEGGLSWGAHAVVDADLGDHVLASLDIGTLGRPATELENITWDDQLVGIAALGWEATDAVGGSLEIAGHGTYAALGDAGSAPFEGLVGGWYRLDNDWVVRAGLGTGLSGGIAAPQARAILGIGYEPPRNPDTDLDGLVDRLDDCPTSAEDADRWLDEDGCPEPTEVTFKFVGPDGETVYDAEGTLGGDSAIRDGETHLLRAGELAMLADAEGYTPLEATLRIPAGPPIELPIRLDLDPQRDLRVRVRNQDGDPLVATIQVGRDEVVSDQAMFEDVEGEVSVVVRAEGHAVLRETVRIPPGELRVLAVELKRLAELKGDRIEIRDSVYFETGKAVIKPESFALLDDVARVLVENPQVKRVRVEGHTDSRGSDSMNMALSKRRAKAVRTYLVEAGVGSGRLESQGYGETKPVAAGNDESAWAQNRRVDFFVTDPAP